MLTKVIGIFLVPLYTRLLTPADYGSLNLVNSTFYFIIVIAVFALDSASARWFYDTHDIEDRKKTISSWFWFQMIASVVFAFIIILGSSFFSRIILNETKPLLFIIPALGLLANVLPGMVTNWLRFQRKAIHTVIFTVSNVLLNIGLNILFVLYLKWGVMGVLAALLISNAVASIYVLALMIEWIKPQYFSMIRLKEMLKYAMPLIPTSIAFWIMNSSSSFIIEHFHGKSEVGLYSIGAMLASAVTMVVGAFQMAWGPFAFSIIDKPEAKQTYSFVLTIYSMVMCFVALVVALFAKEGLMIFTTKEYQVAFLVAGILAFNGIIYGYAYIATVGTSIVKDNKPLAIAVLVAACITGILYFLLVPYFKKEGAAISSALGYLFVPIYIFYRAQKVWPIPYKFMLSIVINLSAIFLFITSLFLMNGNLWFGIAIKFILIIIYIILMFVLLKKYYPEIKLSKFRTKI